jgi:FMN phosphatase YigB (HAD superfamily)
VNWGSQIRAGKVAPLTPKLLSFDVFGTLISVRDSSYDIFRSILADCARSDVRVEDFWEYWEERNIAHYWEPYRPYKEICELSLGEALAHFGIRGNPSLIHRYFDAYLMAHSGVARDEILHVGQSQFTDMVGVKPLGLTIAWINRRGIDLHPSVPRPDFIFADIASLIPLLDGRAICSD